MSHQTIIIDANFVRWCAKAQGIYDIDMYDKLRKTTQGRLHILHTAYSTGKPYPLFEEEPVVKQARLYDFKCRTYSSLI